MRSWIDQILDGPTANRTASPPTAQLRTSCVSAFAKHPGIETGDSGNGIAFRPVDAWWARISSRFFSIARIAAEEASARCGANPR